MSTVDRASEREGRPFVALSWLTGNHSRRPVSLIFSFFWFDKIAAEAPVRRLI